MSSGIPTWLQDKLKDYKTYNLDDLSFHQGLRVRSTTTVTTQTGGNIFSHPKNINEYRNIIKNTLLKELDKNNTVDNYFE
tara:strand:+ start:352 stop:591 length:240 start_codon:yes stop_codon:yes gene_type:complete